MPVIARQEIIHRSCCSPPERQTVTLIAAFKCFDGFLICADSQETCGPYRVRVNKIKPKVRGNFQVAIAGTGNSSVVDDCTLRMEQAIHSLTACNLSDFERTIHEELLDFRKNECSSSDRKTLKFVISALAYNEPKRPFQVWITAGSRLEPVETFAVSGWETEMYKHTAERLYRPGILINQAVFAALYLLRLACETSNYIGEPVKLVAVRQTGMGPYNPEQTKKLSDRMDLFAKQVDSLLLFCPDTSITRKAFAKRLDEFSQTIIHLRHDYLQESAQALMEGDNYAMVPKRFGIKKLPSGGMPEFTDGEPDE